MRPTVPKSHRESERRSVTEGMLAEAQSLFDNGLKARATGMYQFQWSEASRQFESEQPGFDRRMFILRLSGIDINKAYHYHLDCNGTEHYYQYPVTQLSDRGVEKLVSHENHSLETVGSNPAAATKEP